MNGGEKSHNNVILHILIVEGNPTTAGNMYEDYHYMRGTDVQTP